MSEHTPGPWIVGQNGRSNTTIWAKQSDDYRMIAETYRSDDDVVANTHLIAAAPDLLKALEHINKYDNAGLGSIGEALARAAIAKAMGNTMEIDGINHA